ncbi:hypothetical protein [Photobacterium phosphoreum]|uniref:hypothetical protein n=1 Tax=Photobacterium phosphoreum TaxID=659 RepID=UPI001E648EE2|nr:hypothetical protein [Photobacterium phosphoreum]MCD9512125.1 hypothetical protein [Photobacterium phosphoreum]
MVQFETVSSTTNYWFIRAGNNGGKFFQHFKDNGVVALGHADDVGLDYEDDHQFSDAEKEIIIGSTRNFLSNLGESPSQISNKSNQLNRFLMTMKPNDIVITINDNSMMAGRVLSEAYFSSIGLDLHTLRDDTSNITCEYLLRCNVDWGHSKYRGLIPLELEKAFRFTGSIMQFTAHDQIKALNHWLFPIHFVENEVCCTLRISSQDNLSNNQLTKLSSFLDELELISAYVENSIDNVEDVNINNLLSFINLHKEHYNYALKAQHLFMSPGHQFIQLPGSLIRKYIYGGLLAALLSPEAVAFEGLPQNLQLLSSPEVQLLVQEYREVRNVSILQTSLAVNLSRPSLPHINNEENEDSSGSGWGTIRSDQTAL